jgi:hypothetical protein
MFLPYRTTGKIIVLYILIFQFFDSTREEDLFLLMPNILTVVKNVLAHVYKDLTMHSGEETTCTSPSVF